MKEGIQGIVTLGGKHPLISVLAILAIAFFGYLALQGGQDNSNTVGDINQSTTQGDNEIKF